MPISDLRERFRTRLLEFAWSQWAQLGLSSHPTRVDRWAIDPEALILFTVEVARRDPRLFDELLDWMCLNARLLSLQRLRNLSSRFPLDRDLVAAVLAWVSEASPSVRWHAAKPKSLRRKEGLPLFSHDVVAFIGRADPIFQAYGYTRPLAVRTGKSNEPEVVAPISLAFRLRHLFGLGTRSEVIRILLTSTPGPLDAATIADEAGFAKRNVNDALTGLVASGVVKARWSRNERVFLVFRDKWADILEIAPKGARLQQFVSWIHLFPALLETLVWLEQTQEDSEYMTSSRARDLVERIEKDLEILDLVPRADPKRSGTSYFHDFEELAESLLRSIDDRTRPTRVRNS